MNDTQEECLRELKNAQKDQYLYSTAEGGWYSVAYAIGRCKLNEVPIPPGEGYLTSITRDQATIAAETLVELLRNNVARSRLLNEIWDWDIKEGEEYSYFLIEERMETVAVMIVIDEAYDEARRSFRGKEADKLHSLTVHLSKIEFLIEEFDLNMEKQMRFLRMAMSRTPPSMQEWRNWRDPEYARLPTWRLRLDDKGI